MINTEEPCAARRIQHPIVRQFEFFALFERTANVKDYCRHAMAGLTYWGYVMTAIAIVSSVFATIIYLLRLLSRHIARITLRSEDLLMGVGLLLSFVLTTTIIMGM